MTSTASVPRPRGVLWSVLTAHRAALRLWAGFVFLAALGLVGTYLLGEHVQDATALCGRGFVPCPPEVQQQEALYRRLSETASTGLLYLPALVAAFAGAALTGREMEHGTASLAWTQSVSPARWLTAKLALPAVLLTGGMGLLTLLFRWVWLSRDVEMRRSWSWIDVFAASGPVGTAYVLFAFAAGALAGLLVRRQLAGLGLGVALTVCVQLVGHSYRAKLWPPQTVTGEHPLSTVPTPMLLDMRVLTPAGKEFDFSRCFRAGQPLSQQACYEKYDLTQYAVVHPSSHYWPLQLVETGILLACTGLLVAMAFRLLRRRLPGTPALRKDPLP